MKKIPTLFKRIFDERHRKHITPEVTPGLEWVLEGRGIATVKYDGTCCALMDGKFYRRYDAKKGKTPPAGAIPCCDPDPITGHWPHWLECDYRVGGRTALLREVYSQVLKGTPGKHVCVHADDA